MQLMNQCQSGSMNTLVLGAYYLPRKPWKFGNENHDTGCALSDVIWQVNLHEGKGPPAHLGKKNTMNSGQHWEHFFVKQSQFMAQARFLFLIQAFVYCRDWWS